MEAGISQVVVSFGCLTWQFWLFNASKRRDGCHGSAQCDDQGILSTPEVQGKGIEGSDRGMYEKADNDPKPTDQDRPAVDNKMSVLSCAQNVLDEFPSARLSLTRLCPHRALFCMTVRVQGEHTEGKKRMIFRAYASKNPGVWGCS